MYELPKSPTQSNETPKPNEPTTSSNNIGHVVIEEMTSAPKVIAPDVRPAELPSTKKPPKQRHHALWEILSLALILIFLLPILPGKVLGGNDPALQAATSKACSGTAIPIETAGPLKGKAGFPITYTYQRTITSSLECNGVEQNLASKSTRSFNFLGVGIDAVTAVVLVLLATAVVGRLRKHPETLEQ